MPATLAALRIRNLALVERLEWEPGTGFSAVTGETGAGKSAIVGALQLLLGERADRSTIRSGEDSCSVEAEFRVSDVADWDRWLAESGLDPCEDGVLLLKRTLSAEGGGRQFVNGSAATLAALRALGDRLVDLHGPHDHQSLFSAERQMELLDAFAGLQAERQTVRELFAAVGRLEREREELCGGGEHWERERERLCETIEEIDAAGIEPERERELEARYAQAANSRRLIELATGAVGWLEENEDAVSERLVETGRLVRELERLDPGAAPLVEAHAEAVRAIGEVAAALRDYAARLDLDPAQLASMEERIERLQALRRKHGGIEGTLEAVLATRVAAAARLERIERRGVELERIDDELGRVRPALEAAAERLSSARAEAAPRLAGEVGRHLKDLGFARAGFGVELSRSERIRSTGRDTVEFQFAPNVGEPARPLRAIASSGEISRVMLALKTALADQDDVPLLVFDEIDANVGGEIAHAVGAKMAALGRGRQVLCITHLPQVAARADRQFVVRKEVREGRTISRIEPVTGVGREREIARMLGGASESALALARALLAGGVGKGKR